MRLLSALVLALALLIAPQSPRAQAAGDPARQILVMLRLPPQHSRPGRDYGGAYGDTEGRSARMRLANGLARKYGVMVASEWPMPTLGVDCFVMDVPEGQAPEEVAARLSRDPGVSWSEPMHLYRGQAAAQPSHNDPLYRVQPAAREWRLADLHQIATGRRVRIAVVDSMIERNHPDLLGQVEVVENFAPGHPEPPEQHGTGVAGVIAARSDDGVGIAGVAPGARLMGLRACWQDAGATVCDSLSLAKAIDFAIGRGAQIINLSLAGPNDQLLGRLIDVAISRGAVVVGAYDRKLRGGGFPASHRGVIAVADEAGAPIADVYSAPGNDIPTTQVGGRWSMVDGSSFAAAHVSGLFALLKEKAPASRKAPLLVISGPSDTIDTCATLLQMSGPCNCGCSRPHEILAAYAK